MSNIPIRGLAIADLSVPSRGYGGIPIPPVMLTQSGSIRGGDIFTMLNTTVGIDFVKDSFPGGTLSPLWSSATSGSGSVTVNNGLFLNVGTSGGSASTLSLEIFKNFDVTVLFQYNNTVEQFFPTNEITYLRVRAKIDANNYFTLAHMWNPNKGPEIRVSVTTAGVTTIVTTDTGHASARSLRLIRYDGRMQAYAGSVLLADFRGWRTEDVNIELASASVVTPVPISTKVVLFCPQILVTFGTEISPFVQLIANRITGSTPAYKLPGVVEVKIHNINYTLSLGEVFTYFAPLQLTVSGQEGTTIIVNNDEQLRDSTPTLPGLRLYD